MASTVSRVPTASSRSVARNAKPRPSTTGASSIRARAGINSRLIAPTPTISGGAAAIPRGHGHDRAWPAGSAVPRARVHRRCPSVKRNAERDRAAAEPDDGCRAARRRPPGGRRRQPRRGATMAACPDSAASMIVAENAIAMPRSTCGSRSRRRYRGLRIGEDATPQRWIRIQAMVAAGWARGTTRTGHDGWRWGWSGRRGSNSRHAAWKAAALPTELLPLEAIGHTSLKRSKPIGSSHSDIAVGNFGQ